MNKKLLKIGLPVVLVILIAVGLSGGEEEPVEPVNVVPVVSEPEVQGVDIEDVVEGVMDTTDLESEKVIVSPPPEPEPEPVYIPEPKPVFEPTPEPEPVQSCHSCYSGCLNPIASDYDCAGGSGNGPYYTGAVQVYGCDPFGLDRDGDGWGCE